MTLHFRFSDSSRTLADWRRERRNRTGESVWTAVRRYARQHGAAGVWLADDRYRLFYVDGRTLRQKTWASARPLD